MISLNCMRSEIFDGRMWKRLLSGSQKMTPPPSNASTRGYRFPTYEVTLMNHGECEHDISNEYGGWQDCQLSSKGIEQAKRAGKIMSADAAHYHIAYTSELSRAQETVKHVLEPLLVQPKVFATWRLNDRHCGDLTGYNRSQMALVHGEANLKQWMDDYTSVPPIIKLENPKYRSIMDNMLKKHLSTDQIPRTESLHMVYNRVLPYWENIILPSLKMRNKVIIIAHNDSLCALIKRFAELSQEEVLKISLPPAIPFTFTLDNHMRIIKGKAIHQKTSNKKSQGSQMKLPASVSVPPQFQQQLVAQHQLRGGRLSDDVKPNRN